MNSFITLFSALLVIHLLVDFYCQPTSWVNDKLNKHARSPKMLLHSLLHGVLSGIAAQLIISDWRSAFVLFLLVSLSHWLIDLWKTYQKGLRYFIIDQALHIVILALVTLHAANIDNSINKLIDLALTPKHLMLLLGYVFIFKPSSILISQILKKYTPQESGENKGLMAGGEMIGYLERTLILTFVVLEQYSVIGFILAAKSIFRFGELNTAKNHNLTEYVLLGSLLSVTLTSSIGIFIRLIVFGK
ncbi:DUF3307 domain-containing protein [Alteromonas sp. a30]|uniref:DUF3307 domain-containing protein n=1 Tax=Alteromonas sp. a30 TaxID=2730917 RepID=UPI0022806B07|nr:DUF3307 domain-containing protein [Alteromonas sp. a30]MCY7296632.1 DUF3307 domain-containing protein [Alteromonas sp. a30]